MLNSIARAVLKHHENTGTLYDLNEGMITFYPEAEGGKRPFNPAAGSTDEVAASLIEAYGIDTDRAIAIGSRFLDCSGSMSNGAGMTVLATSPLTSDEIASADAGVIALFIGLTMQFCDRSRGPHIIQAVMDDVRNGAPSDAESVEKRIMAIANTTMVCD